jgi:hypothetical protein
MKKFSKLLILIIVCIMAFTGCSSSKKDESTEEDYMGTASDAVYNYYRAMFRLDPDYVDYLAPKAYWDYLSEEEELTIKNIKEYIEDEEYIDYVNDTYETLVGKNASVTYEIADKNPADDSTAETIKNHLESEYNIEKSSIQEVIEIEIELTIKGDDDEDTSETTVNAVEISGNWFLLTSKGEFVVEEIIQMHNLSQLIRL